ncbi:MAG: hypothetical protein LBI44_01080 [Oscillospiraceae bacterium]|jgi:hypothetical protein|nr:hypothetical protein [Oscillospiraceae bacterium]
MKKSTRKTVIFAPILSLLLALAACAGGSPSPSAPANSLSPSQPTPSTPASPSDSTSPSPSPSPSEAEPSPSIDPALSKDGKFRARSTLTEDPRTNEIISYRNLAVDSFNINAKSFEELKELNEKNFAEIYDIFGLELNEDKLYDMLYGKYKYQYDKYMSMFTSKHKHVRDIATLYSTFDWSNYLTNSYWYKVDGVTNRIDIGFSSVLIRDYINNDRDDFDFSLIEGSSFIVEPWRKNQLGKNFMYINLRDVKLPTVEIITAFAYTSELLAKFPFLRSPEEDEILIVAELNDIPYSYMFVLDDNNDFVIDNIQQLEDFSRIEFPTTADQIL